MTLCMLPSCVAIYYDMSCLNIFCLIVLNKRSLMIYCKVKSTVTQELYTRN